MIRQIDDRCESFVLVCPIVDGVPMMMLREAAEQQRGSGNNHSWTFVGIRL